MDHRFVDNATLTGTRITSDGYLVATVRCARTGCQQYAGADIGLTDAGMVNVYRPEEAVFSKDSLATFAHKPVTLGHPADPVTADNWRDHAVGDVGDEIARDGEFVRVPLTIMDAAAIKAVQDGAREISMGYSTQIRIEDGVAPDGTKYQAVQTGPIKINHLALVPNARGGSELRIGDDAANWGASPIHPPEKKESQMADTFQTVVLGDQAAQVAVADAPKIEAFKAAQAKALSDAEERHKEAIEAKDEEIGTLKADKKKLEDASMTPEKMTKMVADRVALESVVRAVDKSIATENVTDADLRKAAVAKVYGDAMVKDASEAEIAGMFKAVAKDAAKDADTFGDAAKSGVQSPVLNDGWDKVVSMKKEA